MSRVSQAALYRAHAQIVQDLERLWALWEAVSHHEHEPEQAIKRAAPSYLTKKTSPPAEIFFLKKDALVHAESFTQRDLIARLLAQECYAQAQQCRHLKSKKGYERWMKLVHRYLDLALKPKRLRELEDIRRELAQLKRQQSA